MTPEHDINAGQILTFTEGTYSEYCILLTCRARTSFNLELWLSSWIDRVLAEDAPKTTASFLHYLTENDLIEDVSAREFNILPGFAIQVGNVFINYYDNDNARLPKTIG